MKYMIKIIQLTIMAILLLSSIALILAGIQYITKGIKVEGWLQLGLGIILLVGFVILNRKLKVRSK
jgi:hypothetical protein